MNKRMSLLCLLLVGSLLAVTAIAQAPQITIKCSDVKSVKGALETDAYGINNKKAIAGDYVDSAGVQHGAIISGKTVTSFDGPAGSSSIAAYGINDSGTAAGWYVDSNGNPQGFTWKGSFTSIAVPNALGTEANGINASGTVVGEYFDTAGVGHGFSFDGKKYHTFDAPGSGNQQTAAWDINASGQISVWEIDSAGNYHSFIYDGTNFTAFDVPGATGSVIHGISDKGDLDYTIFDSAGNRHGVLYQKSTNVFTQFDDPKGTNTTRADGINNKDIMVGRYSPSSGNPPSAGFKCTVKK